ncbi:MAG TPA: hypothetical protein VJN48_00895 [Terriglobales bacterium]|nr:hypothetical protein [Terriglobales bacterium]
MTKLLLCLLLLVVTSGAIPQKPIPPGLRQSEQAEQQGELNIPPPMNQPTKPSFAQVQHDADQLASLARGLPDQVGELSRGIRPKDLDQRLKDIEKLSKRLRSNLRRM